MLEILKFSFLTDGCKCSWCKFKFNYKISNTRGKTHEEWMKDTRLFMLSGYGVCVVL